MNGTNDHHGGHERGEKTFDSFQDDVPWAFAHQARGHHNTEKLGNNTKVWLEKHVLGKDLFWPKLPDTKIHLDADGIPEFLLKPNSKEKLEKVKIYYALKNPISFGRAWRDTTLVKENNIWRAKLPVMNVDDYVFGFAQLNYQGDIVITSKFQAAIPSNLGNAIATDEPRNSLEGTTGWANAAPVEGIGSVMGFRALNKHRGTLNEQFSDPAFKAPENANLKFEFYCTQPQNITIEVNGLYMATIEITASNDWQSKILSANMLKNKHDQQAMKNWSNTHKLSLKSAQGSDITKVVFAKFQWDKNEFSTANKEIKPASLIPTTEKGEKVYLTKEMISSSNSHWRIMNGQSVSGNEMLISNVPFTQGLGVHADSKLTFDVNKDFSFLHVTPGTDSGHNGNIVMKIMLDNNEVYHSGIISNRDLIAPEPLRFPISEIKTITLEVTNGEDGIGGDHANWADLYLIK
jgi:hypothetical protein